jgi:IS30 family transposase
MNTYNHLTLEEREKLFAWNEAKINIREIGRRLKRG